MTPRQSEQSTSCCAVGVFIDLINRSNSGPSINIRKAAEFATNFDPECIQLLQSLEESHLRLAKDLLTEFEFFSYSSAFKADLEGMRDVFTATCLVDSSQRQALASFNLLKVSYDTTK